MSSASTAVSTLPTIVTSGRFCTRPVMMICAAGVSLAETDGFDQQGAPKGWLCGVTGRGAPKWAVEADASAPSPPNVLRQSGHGTFPWCAKQDVAVSDEGTGAVHGFEIR